MTSPIAPPIWEILQSLAPRLVVDTLVEKHFWSLSEGPTDRFLALTKQLARYFRFYPDSETLRAEFESEFGGLTQSEQDSLFRLVKSLHLGRGFLHSVI